MFWGRALAVILAIAGTTLALPARGDTSAYALFIERSPADAGNVTPKTGAHRFSANSRVALSADPRPGYRFAYWLGDVSDPSAQRTTIVVNEPKVVIAVFSPEPRKRAEEQVRSPGGGGSGMMVPTATDFSTPTWSPAGGAEGKTVPVLVPVIVTPEPSTITLIGLGLVLLRRARR
jgi:hypothetical protein